MKIERIELHEIRMRLKAAFETSFGVEHDRDCLIVRVLSEGLEGWGECVAGRFPGFSYETTQTAWHVLEDFLAPLMLGTSIDDVGDYRRKCATIRGHPLARAGLELALWDLIAKAQQVSLTQLFGGVALRVPVGVSIGIQSTSDALLDVVAGYVDRGYARVKLKIKPGRDVSDVHAVRESFADLKLQVDANAAYSLEDIAVFEALDEVGLLLIEQPLAEDDLLDHGKLQAALSTPICLDESIRGLRQSRQALEIEACRVINIKQARVGGIQEALDIHEFCWGENVPVWCGGMLETGIGRAANLALASLPGFRLPGDISATDRYYEEDIASPRFALNSDSTIDVPRGLGIGVEIDTAALDRFTLRREVLKP
ncbi:MAG: o-succinylbenzoate synthase [Anaerolineales bacterium]|nr:o-succinylbenzoate synthase [Anaerolineales bacterium]